MRLSGTLARSISTSRGLGNPLWDLAGSRPSLDLRFAESKSLVDATTGSSLVTFTRASGGTYIGSDGLIKTATTNEPRFDHNPTTGESLGLLVEESRVNNVLQSESVTTSPWGVFGSPTFTINDAISPAGNLTSDLAIGNNSEAFAGAAQVLSSLVIGNNYSVSLFVKPNTATTTRLGLFNAATTLWNFYVDIAWTAGIPSTQSTFGSPTNVEYRSYGNGWYRCSLTGAVDTTTPQFIFQPDRTATSKSAWIWGASVESGSAGASALFPTSYIPTEGSAVTRATDVASISGANFSSWYQQDAGTVFAESLIPFDSLGTIVSFDDNTSNNRWQMRFMDSPTRSRYRFVSSSGSYDYALISPAFKIGSASKAAFCAKSSDQGYSIDSEYAQVPAPQATMPTVNQIQIGAGAAADQAQRLTIRRLTYWTTRLPNETLQAITQ